MFSLLFPCVGKLKIAGIMQAVSRALECFFQRRKLGAANSGGCLSCGRRRKPPPTLHDWSDDMCRALTRFTADEVWQLLERFDMLRPDGQPKMYRIYTSLKSYHKRGKRTKHKKYFLCSAETAMMVLLCHMARPGGYVALADDLQWYAGARDEQDCEFLVAISHPVVRFRVRYSTVCPSIRHVC
jgi:hypothetical protein